MATIQERQVHNGAGVADTTGVEAALTTAAPALQPRLLNAQLSQLEFNRRVLEEALDESHPLLERVKFLSIVHSNLDEFFGIAISGLRAQREGVQAGTAGLLPDGRTPSEALSAVEERLQPLLEEQEVCCRQLQAQLAQNGIHILGIQELDHGQREFARQYFEEDVFPVLTPLAVDPAHPFPHISHLSLNLAVMLDDPQAGRRFARVKIPPNLPRLVAMPMPANAPAPVGDAHQPAYFVWLEALIAAHLDQLFPGVPVVGRYVFRVTRDFDQDIRERDTENLLGSVKESLRERTFSFVVRLEYTPDMPETLRSRLIDELEATEAICNEELAPLGRRDLMALYALDRPDLKDPPFVPRVPAVLGTLGTTSGQSIFDVIRRRDLVLHHPFDSFGPVVQFIEAAAADPDVLAIKQTLYRVGRSSPIVDALMRAREAGKQVAVLLELKARDDEENNIRLAELLEDAGVHVVYGIIGLKTHCKTTLVVRREADGIRRYCHIGTGNYNATTARLYTDLCLFTANPDIGADLTDLFNYLTGWSRQDKYRKVLVSPTTWRRRLVELIDREMAHAAHREPARIIIKVNGLTDPRIIDLLYRASDAGVKIDLIVRGMCCLRPGVPGLSENIRVISVVGRFLEHSRLYFFENGGAEELYVGSADIMARNLDRRVEVVCPILDDGWRALLKRNVLDLYLRDTVRARELQPDGSYARLRPQSGKRGVDAQQALLSLARETP
ncbi:MAG TPA: polyphosphate kinase 1 [Chloroflexota bacterium]|nr:polyphosphate kinase 1 [Chloroflexota bacterium]